MFTFVKCWFLVYLLCHIFYIAVDSTETILESNMSHIEKRGSIPITAVCFDNRYDVLIIVGSMMN